MKFVRPPSRADTLFIYGQRAITCFIASPCPKPTRIGLVDFLEEALFNGSVFSHVASLLFLYNVASSFEVFDDEFWYAAPNGDAGLGQRVSNDVHLFLAV